MKKFTKALIYLLSTLAVLCMVLSMFFSALPTATFAASQNFAQLSASFVTILLDAAWIISAMSFLVFVVGVIRFIASAGNEKGLEGAKFLIISGLIGLTVMVCVWGLVKLVGYVFLGQTFQ